MSWAGRILAVCTNLGVTGLLSAKGVVFGVLRYCFLVYTKGVGDSKLKCLCRLFSRKQRLKALVFTIHLMYRRFIIFLFITANTLPRKNAILPISGIENFWNQAKWVLRKYYRILKKNFHLFIKECELRFDYGMSKQQLIILIKWF